MSEPESGRPIATDDPLVIWLQTQLLPLIGERLSPERVIVFKLPQRIEQATRRPPGLLIVAHAFDGIPVPERNALVTALTDSVLPVRPLCLTPGEFAVSGTVAGPVLEAVRSGLTLSPR